MPISTEEKNGIVYIKWTTQVQKGFPSNGVSMESFQLNRFLKYVYYFDVSCTYNAIMSLGRHKNFCMELDLKQVDSPKNTSASVTDETNNNSKEAVPNYYLVQYLSGKCVLRANGVKWTKGTHFPERYCTRVTKRDLGLF